MPGKRLIISGASGYIASNLLNYFNKKNYLQEFNQIILLDRTFKNERFDFSLNNYGNLKTRELDLSKNSALIIDDFRQSEFQDIVIHSAYFGNLELEKKFLESLNPNSYLVFLSSSAVYGEAKFEDGSLFSNKEEQALKPIGEYGRYKKELEELVTARFPKNLILRISNPYGLEPDSRGVMKIFKDKILKDEFIELNEPEAAEESAKIVRDFIYIEDLVRNLYRLLLENSTGVFNLASGEGLKLEDLIKSYAASYYKEPKIIYKGHKPGDIIKSVLDLSKLQKLLRRLCFHDLGV